MNQKQSQPIKINKQLMDEQYISIYAKWLVTLNLIKYKDLFDNMPDDQLKELFEKTPRNFDN